MLTARLRELEAAGIIEKRIATGAGRVYALSEAGKALEPALLALIRWGLAYGPSARKGDHHLDDWDLLALKALFQPQRADDLVATVQFETDDFLAWMTIDKGRVAIGLGEADDPDIIIAGTIKDLFTGSRSPDDLLASEPSEKLAPFMDAFVMPAEV